MRYIMEFRRKELKKILSSLKKRRAVALVGDSGVGKSELAREIFKRLGYRTKIVNGSFTLKDEDVAVNPCNLRGEQTSLIINEMDRGLKSNYQVLLKSNFIPIRTRDKKTKRKVITSYETVVPTIMTLNHKKSFKFSSKVCDMIKIDPLDSGDIYRLLFRKIRKSKGINKTLDRNDIKRIAESCNGDIRMALSALNGGEITKMEPTKAHEMLRALSLLEPEERCELMEKEKLGEYGGVGVEWFISLLSRNFLKRGSNEVDYHLLEKASEMKYLINIKFTRMLLSMLEQKKVSYIKFPKRKKKGDK
jgi:ABC-type dipeptide/oligopeptide/nickel transport system ATPase component